MKKMNILLTLCLGAMLASCGGAGDLAASGNSNGAVGGGGQVSQQLSTLNSFMETNPENLPNEEIAITPFLGAYDGCKDFLIGSSTSDDHYKLEYTCRGINDGSNTKDFLGTVEQKMKDATKPWLGYRRDFDLRDEILGGSANWTTYKGFHELSRTSTQIKIESDVNYHTVMEAHNPVVDWGYRRVISRVYTPTDMNNPGDAGKLSLEAFFKIEGKVGGGPGGIDLGITKITFEIKSEGLEYDSSCGTYFVKGAIKYKDGSNNVLSFNYDGCAAAVVKYNGKTISLM